MTLLWGAFGLIAAYWAQYWPSGRAEVPGMGLFALHILGFGLVVPLAHLVMDRPGVLPRLRAWVLLIAPGIAVAIRGTQSVADPNPLRLALPVMQAWLMWVMRRLGRGGGGEAGSGFERRNRRAQVNRAVI